MSNTEQKATNNRQVATLKKTVKAQSDKISTLVMRISSLTDEVADLKRDLLRLRDNVGADLQDLYDKANNNTQNQ